MKSVTLQEWEERSLNELGIARKAVDQLLSLASQERRRLRVAQNVLTETITPGLKAGQVVGVLSVPGVSLEILPKLQGHDWNARQALTRMITVALDIPIAAREYVSMARQSRDLLEVVVRVFVDLLRKATRRGLPHRYRSEEEDLSLLRGKLNINRQVLIHASRPDKLACIYDELSADTPLNRVLKATVGMLMRVARNSDNLRSVFELMARLDLVSDSANPLGEPVVLDRTNSSYHRIYGLARLLLSSRWQNTSIGNDEGIALLFEMNQLFERFVARCFQIGLGSTNVRLQRSDKHALLEGNRRLFTLKPDIVIHNDIIVDTKWKVLDLKEPRLGVSSADVYQMLAYAQAYKAERLVLLYPWHAELGSPGILKRWRVTGTEVKFDIATVDVSLSDEVPEALVRLVDSAA